MLLPEFNDTIKLTQVKKMFHLIVNEITLKEWALRITK